MTAMLNRLILAAFFLLAGCASNVYDSLDSRGVERGDLLLEQISQTRGALVESGASLEAMADAFAAVQGEAGAALAKRADKAAATQQAAAAHAQTLRIRISSLKSVGKDYFNAKERDIGFMKESAEKFNALNDLGAENGEFDAVVTACLSTSAHIDRLIAA